MALQFVVGNSGSGKTEYIFRRVTKEAEEHPDKTYLVLVPEQFTMQTQRKLVELSGSHAIMNIDVLSFKRLAYRVFDELGIKTGSVLEETGKNLVIQKVAQKQAQKLTVLREKMNRIGYIGEMKSILSELQQYHISQERLKEYLEKTSLPPSLREKLKDVLVMYEGYESFLENTFLTEEEILHVLGRVAKDSELISHSVLVFDEFTGFTPVQNKLLAQLFPLADQIYVALTIDAKENIYKSRGEHDLFHMPKQTIAILKNTAQEAGIEVNQPILLSDANQKRFVKAPAIAFMEQNLFRPYYQRRMGKEEEISIHSVLTPKQELHFAARKIYELVHKEGYRYREIAVVTGDMELYKFYAEEVFENYQIPVYLDTTREILFHPFIEFVRSLFELIQSDFSYEAVMRGFRCGFYDFLPEELDELDNYLIATGIRGWKKWDQMWLRLIKGMEEEQLERIEEMRSCCAKIWREFVEKMSQKESTAKSQISAVCQFMEKLGVEEKLNQKACQYEAENKMTKAQEYRQIYTLVMQLFEKCICILGEEKLSIRELSEVLDAGMDAMKVATIPQGYDTLIMGDIERTRLNSIKVLFFVGINDGIVPKVNSRGGILSQFERELLKDANLPLAPTARELAFIQKYYLYLNMTKPSEQLFLSYHRVNKEGKAVRPSYLIGVMSRMFPDMEIKEWGDLTKEWNLSTTEAAMQYFLHGKKDENWMVLAKLLLEKEETKDLLEAGFFRYEPQKMSRIIAGELYGEKMRGSVTRLEQFASCAYAHFLKYGLRLKERQNNDFDAMDVGNLYHAALERYSKKIRESSHDWFTIPEESRIQLAHRSLGEVIAEYSNQSIQETASGRNQLARMEHVFQQTIWALTKQIQKGKFIPNEFETGFQDKEGIGQLRFSLKGGAELLLEGRIDRIDLYEEPDKIAVKIVDYKTGSKKLQLLKVYQGTQLQLVVYMNAALSLTKEKYQKQVVPGGIFYYHIDDPVIELEGDVPFEAVQEEILKKLRPDGFINSEKEIYEAMDDSFETESLVIPARRKKNGELSKQGTQALSGEEFATVGAFVTNRIVDAANEILDGNVEISPQKDGTNTSCQYCSFRSVCAFDQKVDGYSYRNMKQMKNEEVLSKMEIENAARSD